ncbi:acyl-CoA carboxylase epsilon subunit [Streptomyces anulatus]|uniref:Pga11 n=1 Tax=Streptomyces sp. PGA64 TaxID=161235 RepID=X5DRN8_9ACTN|nr:Pga11 [Streptomyces sp. PGA64]
MPDQQTVSDPDPVLRVVKGSPSPEELAAVTALLLARMAPPGDDAGGEGSGGPGPDTAGWRRPGRRPGFLGPRTWHRL